MKELLENYTKYNLWANTKLIGFIKKIDPSLLDKELVSSFKTIRETIFHIWDAEQIWYNRLAGVSFTSWPSESFKGTDNEFMKSFIEQSSKFVGYVEDKSEAELIGRFDYKTLEGREYNSRAADSILHCMNHSTFHRGQLVTMLRNVGYTELSSTDYITFTREMKI
jgi:uncharacterized damage-inducible protein DinB